MTRKPQADSNKPPREIRRKIRCTTAPEPSQNDETVRLPRSRTMIGPDDDTLRLPR